MAKIIIEINQLVPGTGGFPIGGDSVAVPLNAKIHVEHDGENELLAAVVAMQLEEVYRGTLEAGIKGAVDAVMAGAENS